MMQFGSVRDTTGSTRDRVVVTQSQNFGSYAQKLVANMNGCPCIDLVNQIDKSAYGSSSLLEGMAKPDGDGEPGDGPATGAITPQVSATPLGAWTDIEKSG